MAEYTHIRQPFEPVYDEHSEILILGSLPSVKSRENGFYYGHPQNRFWKVLAALLGCEVPTDIEGKKKLLLEHHIALWDVIKECDIIGSADSSIKNAVPADITKLLRETKIQYIYVNGKTAEKYYKKYLEKATNMKAVVLPSTSPANAAFSIEELIAVWKDELIVRRGSYTYDLMLDYQEYYDILTACHMAEHDAAEFAFVYRDLYSEKQQVKQRVKQTIYVWYQVGIDGKETVVMSLGSFYDDWIDAYEAQGDLFKAYIVENLAMGILKKAYDVFYSENKANTGLSVSNLHFLDEDEMEVVPRLLERLYATDVQINEAYALIPQKTVVFSVLVQGDGVVVPFSDNLSHLICEQCPNVNCPNRNVKGMSCDNSEGTWLQTFDAEGSEGSEDAEGTMDPIMAEKIKKRKKTSVIKRKSSNMSYGYQRIIKKEDL